MNSPRHVFRTRSTGPLEEIHISLGQYLARSLVSLVFASAIIAGVIAGVSAVIILLAALVADWTQLGVIPYRVAVVFGCTWCLFAALAAPRTLAEAIFGRTLRYRANDEQLLVEIGPRQREHNFAGCSWKRRDPFPLECRGGDAARLMVFCDGRKYWLGYSDMAADKWSHWLKSHQAKEITGTHPGFLSFLTVSWYGSVTGGSLALALALLFRWTSGVANSQETIVILGYLDGLLAVFCRELFHGRQFHRYGSLASALFLALACAALVLTLPGVPWQIAALNPLVGATVGWLVFPGKSRED